MSIIDAKIAELNLTLPQAPAPLASYVSCVRSGNLVFISGQLPKKNDAFLTGTLGDNISIEEAKEAAKLCALSLISQLKSCINNLDNVVKCVKLCIFVNSVKNFDSHSVVANGASDLMVSIFGDAGKHARSSIGVSSLPFNACVEVEGIFEVK